MKRHALLATLLGTLTSLPLHVSCGETTEAANVAKQSDTSLDALSNHVEIDTPVATIDGAPTDVISAVPADYSSDGFQMQDFMAGTNIGSIGDGPTDFATTEDSTPFPQEETLVDNTNSDDITTEESSTALQEQDAIANIYDVSDKQR